MITVVAGGDSFVFGAELKDQVRSHSMSTFPALLSKSAGCDYICSAVSGSANAAIARRVIDNCEHHKDKNLFVIVNWTFTNRYEFYFNNSINRLGQQWYSLTHWDTFTSINDIEQEHSNDRILNHHKEHFLALSKTGIGEFAKMFYTYPGNTEVYELYTTLKDIVFLQQYLKEKKIPYLFTCVDTNIFYSLDLAKKDISVVNLGKQIDLDPWFFFPSGTTPDETNNPRGFYQWAMENKYPVGTTHPLEEAHADAAKLMQEKFNELVKKSIQ